MAAVQTGVHTRKKINILLIGKTGSGKSATGNTLLGAEDVFESSNNISSVTKKCKVECSENDNMLLRVVDTPGLMDTEIPNETTIEEICNGASLCEGGFNAILYVIKWGYRFTNEDVQTMKMFKQAFGEGFIRDFGIVVMTNGDNFITTRRKRTNYSFQDWVNEQKSHSEFSAIAKECGGRFLLFFNTDFNGFDEYKRNCMKELFDLINSMPESYTNAKFQAAAKERERLAIQLKLPSQANYVQDQLSLIKRDIDKMEKVCAEMKTTTDPNQLEKLKKDDNDNYQHLKKRLKDLLDKITLEDKGTNVMTGLMENIKENIKNVETISQLNENEKKLLLAGLKQNVEASKIPDESWGKFWKTALGTVVGGIGGAAVGLLAAAAAPVAAAGASVAGIATAIYQSSK